MVRTLVLISTLFLLAAPVLEAALPVPAAVNIEGVVKDSQTGDPLPGANVVLAGTSLGASADINGKYTIRSVTPGSFSIRVTYVGYKSVTIPIQVAEGGTFRQDFKLVAVSIEGETVVVTAQASGQNAAINQQLSSNSITNVVSAARIQELPDANAAESVGRLPGVSVLRNGGEGTQIVIRGLQPKYNNVTVDGVRMASSNPNDRSTDLSMISPLSLEGIEVSKTVTADQDADVIGGSVNFTMKEARGGGVPGLAYNLLVQGGYNGLTDAYHKYNNYRYVGSVEGRFFDEQLGVFAQADLERRNLTSNELGTSFTNLGNSIDYLTNSVSVNDIARDRQRENGTLVLDYKLPEGKIVFSNFFSTGATDIQNRGETFNTSGTVLNTQNYTFGYQNSTLNLITNSIALEHEIPLFHALLRLSHTYSETKDPDDWTVGFIQSPAGLSQFSGKANVLPAQVNQAAIVDESTTNLNSLINTSNFSRERAYTVSLDLDRPVNLSDGVTAVIKFGGKYRYQTRSYVQDQYTGQGLNILSGKDVRRLIAQHFPSTLGYQNADQIPIIPFLDPGFSYAGFLNGDYKMSLPMNYGMLAEMARFARHDPQILGLQGGLGYFHDPFNSESFNYDGHEAQGAFYAMATINIGSDITLIPGVRYQDFRRTYTARRGQQNNQSVLGSGAYNSYDTTLTVDNPYWLPDLLVRYKPLSWFDVRLSYSNTVSYPDYNAIIPRIDVPNTGGSITYNNYKLNPTRSTNYDAYVSVYDNSIGLLTGGVFLKRITDLIYASNFYVSDSAAIPYYPPYLATIPPTGSYNVITYVNDKYRIDDYGMEIDWQTHFWYLPHPLDGLVLNVNYTHIFSKAQYPYVNRTQIGGFRGPVVFVDTSYTDRLLDQPDNILNLSLGYDYEGFSVRVSLLYQDNIFAGTNFWPQLRSTTSAYTRWDLSVKQNLPWFGIQLYGDINNINSASDQSTIAGTTVPVPSSRQSYGLTGDVGLRWHF
jgi:TonB-dependent receptor